LARHRAAFAFLAVIPAGNLLLPLPFLLSFPQGICFCLCRCLLFAVILEPQAKAPRMVTLRHGNSSALHRNPHPNLDQVST
jgi:hypothetical protein